MDRQLVDISSHVRHSEIIFTTTPYVYLVTSNILQKYVQYLPAKGFLRRGSPVGHLYIPTNTHYKIMRLWKGIQRLGHQRVINFDENRLVVQEFLHSFMFSCRYSVDTLSTSALVWIIAAPS